MHDNDFYGDKFKWFVGVVKEKDSSGRVRVRVYGIHRMEDVTDVSDEDLPWATVLLPATSGQTSSSNADVALDTGDWVVGFFADGDNCQQPVVLGVLGGGLASDNYSPTGGDLSAGGDTSGDVSGGDSGSDPGNVPSISDNAIPGNTNAEKLYVALRTEWEKRVSGDAEKAHMLACAVMGNMQQESGLHPDIQGVMIDRKTGRPEGAFGLIQWRGLARRSKLFKRVFGDNMEPAVRAAINTEYGLLPDRIVRGQHYVTCPYPSIADQVSFMFWEFDHTYVTAYNKILATNNIRDATWAIGKYYIGPKVVESSRTRNAMAFDKKFRGYAERPSRD